MEYYYKNSGSSFQLFILALAYIITSSAILITSLYFARDLPSWVSVFGSLALITIAVLFWAYLHAIFRIPSQMASEFDPIKNDISSGKIHDIQEFSKQVTVFITRFFNYTFFDIEQVYMKVDGLAPYSTIPEIESSLDWEAVEKKATHTDDIFGNGSLTAAGSKYFAYTIPIFFNNRYMGFFTVFAKQKLGPQRRKYLIDLEENFIDDQLLLLTKYTDI